MDIEGRTTARAPSPFLEENLLFYGGLLLVIIPTAARLSTLTFDLGVIKCTAGWREMLLVILQHYCQSHATIVVVIVVMHNNYSLCVQSAAACISYMLNIDLYISKVKWLRG